MRAGGVGVGGTMGMALSDSVVTWGVAVIGFQGGEIEVDEVVRLLSKATRGP